MRQSNAAVAVRGVGGTSRKPAMVPATITSGPSMMLTRSSRAYSGNRSTRSTAGELTRRSATARRSAGAVR